MANKNLPEQIPFSSSLNDTRKELNDKIDTKISTESFYWIIGILVVICCGIIYNLYTQINLIKDNKIEDIQKRVTILETKFDGHTNSSQKFEDDLQKQLSNIEKKIDTYPDVETKKSTTP